jgi:hypothetical protein
MSNNMQNMQTIWPGRIYNKICGICNKIWTIICRICNKICKIICRIVTGLYSAYLTYICRICQKNMQNNMQNMTRNMQAICRIWQKICKIICRICKKYVKNYATPFSICRIVTGSYSAYFAYIYTPHFADDASVVFGHGHGSKLVQEKVCTRYIVQLHT